MSAAKIPARSATRYELKAVVEEPALPSVQAWLRLHEACFSVRFPARRVNSLYFDTPNLDSFADNLSGVSQRHKVRLRWYGASSDPVQVLFEVKLKHHRNGWKLSQKIEQLISFDELSWIELVAILRRELAPELQAYLFQGCAPVLLVRYHREYYETFDGRIRVTVDHHLEAYDQRQYSGLTLRYPWPQSPAAIIECKGSPANSEAIAAVLATAPFRVTRSSKYVDGLADILAP